MPSRVTKLFKRFSSSAADDSVFSTFTATATWAAGAYETLDPTSRTQDATNTYEALKALTALAVTLHNKRRHKELFESVDGGLLFAHLRLYARDIVGRKGHSTGNIIDKLSMHAKEFLEFFKDAFDTDALKTQAAEVASRFQTLERDYRPFAHGTELRYNFQEKGFVPPIPSGSDPERVQSAWDKFLLSFARASQAQWKTERDEPNELSPLDNASFKVLVGFESLARELKMKEEGGRYDAMLARIGEAGLWLSMKDSCDSYAHMKAHPHVPTAYFFGHSARRLLTALEAEEKGENISRLCALLKSDCDELEQEIKNEQERNSLNQDDNQTQLTPAKRSAHHRPTVLNRSRRAGF